ncbi:MAG: hypothetical protein M9900_08580 [Flavobacteriales bacterium]|nr:hypothetical protein [Flavobacteriales bacterium]
MERTSVMNGAKSIVFSDTIRWIAICMIVLTGCGSRAQAPHTNHRLITVNLPEGVTVSIPSNWVRFTKPSRESLNDMVVDSLGRYGLTYTPSDLSFAANLYNNEGVVVAMFNIRYYPYQTVTQKEIMSLSRIELSEYDKLLQSEIEEGAIQMKRTVPTWAGSKKIMVHDYCTLLSEYKRPSPNGGIFYVRLQRVMDADKSFTITVSYREDAGLDVKNVADGILKSLRKR